MEVAPVTFNTYRTIFLQSEPSILAITRTIRDFIYRLGLHSRVTMLFMVFTMIFVFAFPTFASAMTGYQGKVQAFINDSNGNLVPFNDFRHLAYIIHDGKRINMTDDQPLSYDFRPGGS